jgi:N-acetylglucosamine transport system permease protein
MIPMAKGPILAIGIMAVISGWNNYTTPILYLDKMPTLASGLYYFNQAIQYVDNKPAYFAGVIMSMIPALILFTIFSDKIMGNVVMGGLKG